MSTKTVLIVEDQPGIRMTYSYELERSGFDVISAGTVAEARNIIDKFGEDIAVAVLDMRLNDLDRPEITGADIGIELKRKCANKSPEILIRSGFAEVGYYRIALELGTAVYLSKSDTTLDDVIQHVKALALKHSLKFDVYEPSRSSSGTNIPGTFLAFCKQLLAPQVSSCLGTPYILLLTDENGTQNCMSDLDLPLGYNRIYELLQAMTYADSDTLNPYTFDAKHFSPGIAPQESNMIERLDGVVLVSLANIYDYRLSLGLLSNSSEDKSFDRTRNLANIIARYVPTTIVGTFVKNLVQLNTRRNTMLSNTSQLCLFLGRDQLAIVDEGAAMGELHAESITHQRLRLMAEDLEETGAILMNATGSASDKERVRVEIAALIAETWAELSEIWKIEHIDFKVEGSCSVIADEDDLYIVVARVLQWLVQRSAHVIPPHKPAISAHCQMDKRDAIVVFEDHSQRLPMNLRERLFEPFTLANPSARNLATPLVKDNVSDEDKAKVSKYRPSYFPLYLAKMIVEEKYHGSFDDKSDELEKGAGHRLIMRFRRLYEPKAVSDMDC